MDLSLLSLEAETEGVRESEIVDLANYLKTAEDPALSIPLESVSVWTFRCCNFGSGALAVFGS